MNTRELSSIGDLLEAYARVLTTRDVTDKTVAAIICPGLSVQQKRLIADALIRSAEFQEKACDNQKG